MPWTDAVTLARQHRARVIQVFHGACVQARKLDLGHASLLVVAVSVPLFLCLLEETGTSKTLHSSASGRPGSLPRGSRHPSTHPCLTLKKISLVETIVAS